jgi:hypothetical protein
MKSMYIVISSTSDWILKKYVWTRWIYFIPEFVVWTLEYNTIWDYQQGCQNAVERMKS